MKVSIITVCYNAKDTIEDTLKSLQAQDYPNIEHIVIDGGSKDGTQAILERYKDNIAVLISEKDNGIYDAMNKGLARATGEIIGILNADDVYKHNHLISQIVDHMQMQHLDAIYADVEYFRSKNPDRIVRRYRSPRFCRPLIPYGWMPAHPSLFLRSYVYERFGTFKTDYRIAADYEFVARIFYGTNLRYHYVPEVWVRMRMGGVSTGGFKNTCILNKEVLRACRENKIPTNMINILSKYPRKFLGLMRR